MNNSIGAKQNGLSTEVENATQHDIAMAKEKTKSGVTHKHLHARISFLQQAATYLTSQAQPHSTQLAGGHQDTAIVKNSSIIDRSVATSHEQHDSFTDGRQSSTTATRPPADSPFQLPPSGGLPLLLSAHMSQVARKSQIRLSSEVKHRTCKRCNTTLVEGMTSTKTTENLSKGRRRPHADVLVVECRSCGAPKRFPIGAKRQSRKSKRQQNVKPPNLQIAVTEESTQNDNVPE